MATSGKGAQLGRSGRGVPRAVVLYTAGRLLLFVLVALALNLGTGLTGPVLLLLALLVSSLVGYFALARQRDGLSTALAARARDRAERQAALQRRLEEPGEPHQP